MLSAHCQISQSCGWWYPFNDFCIITDRPSVIARDEEGRLHSETGPALSYRDGSKYYSWRGLAVPSEWIESPEQLTASTALTWKNIEQRRAGCEILGWDKILTELNARTINIDGDPEIGELVEVEIPDIGKERFLRVLCGTGRSFALPVPPGMTTALQANAWTFGHDNPDDFLPPEVRT